jgi:hypothetical protein
VEEIAHVDVPVTHAVPDYAVFFVGNKPWPYAFIINVSPEDLNSDFLEEFYWKQICPRRKQVPGSISVTFTVDDAHALYESHFGPMDRKTFANKRSRAQADYRPPPRGTAAEIRSLSRNDAPTDLELARQQNSEDADDATRDLAPRKRICVCGGDKNHDRAVARRYKAAVEEVANADEVFACFVVLAKTKSTMMKLARLPLKRR